jgi:uncharacterized membrane protein
MKPFEERLEVESAEWVRAGLLNDEQRTAILLRHPHPAGANSRFIGIVATVGGVLFAVGISLIIKSNWEMIGDWTKIVGLVALLVGAYATGWKLKVVEQRFEKTGDAALMVGGIFFLCGIALVSQIFHLNSRPATGVLAWWLGIVAVPWLARARGAQFLSIVAALAWLGKEMTTPGSWIEVGASSSDHVHNDAAIVAVFFLLGVALWLSGLALRATRWDEFASMHEKWGLLVTFGSLYWLGFLRHYWVFRHGTVGLPDATTMFALSLGVLLALAAGFGAWRSSAREVKSLAPWLVIALVPMFGVLLLGSLGDAGWLWSALAWVSLFVLSIGVVRIGLETGREGWVNLGILCIATNVVTRYFDLFGSMLEGGVFFIVTGVLVTGLGIYLEKKRRALVATLRTEARS